MSLWRRNPIAHWLTRQPVLTSCLCTEKTLLSPAFQGWALKLKEAPGHLHRKTWEWCFISEALRQTGMLRKRKQGLGFAVGQEPLAALYATYGATIVATDLFTAQAQADGWVETAQHASGYEAINLRGICDAEVLRRRVRFQFADMNQIGTEFDNRFDFVWSACALEHLGSLGHGRQFILDAMRCLKPGGVAVHTTEFNLSSQTPEDPTVETGGTVLYRRCDIEEIAGALRAQGHSLSIDWNAGDGVADGHLDVAPYKHDVHLKLLIGDYKVTSIGLIVRKALAA